MKFTKQLLASVAASLLISVSMTQAAEISGVKVGESGAVGNAKLNLNGAGVFYKGLSKVYVAELYAGKKVNSLEDLYTTSGPKRIKMTFVRDIESAYIGKLMTRGIEDNSPRSELSKLIPGLMRMGEIFSTAKTFVEGDVVTLDWIPGTGLVVNGKGKQQGEPFKEPEFFYAIASVWLGQQPTNWKLKDQLLGIQ